MSKKLTNEQIEAVVAWMSEWTVLSGTSIPLRFKEDFRSKVEEPSSPISVRLTEFKGGEIYNNSKEPLLLYINGKTVAIPFEAKYEYDHSSINEEPKETITMKPGVYTLEEEPIINAPFGKISRGGDGFGNGIYEGINPDEVIRFPAETKAPDVITGSEKRKQVLESGIRLCMETGVIIPNCWIEELNGYNK